MSYTPSKVVALFLTEFDHHAGYIIRYQKSTISDFDFTGLDYKSMPSGVHEYNKSSILISHISNNQRYYGLTKFAQYFVGEDTQDRNNIKIFSLSILCQPNPSIFKPNEFINNGWEFINDLNFALVKYLQGQNYQDYTGFDKLFQELTTNRIKNTNLLSPGSGGGIPDVTNHPLTKLPQLFKTFGPLVFVLYKQSLLRKRILIFNQHHIFHDDEDLLPNEDHDLLLNLSTFCYLISLLSIIPREVETSTNVVDFSQPIYSVGLNDLTGELFTKTDNYIGTTNDDILIENNKIYDFGVMIDEKVTSFQDNHNIKATNKDYHKFQLIYQDLPLNSKFNITNNRNLSTEDLNSITSNTINNSKDFDPILRDNSEEPDWWKNEATESISWRESIWSAFSWFATAGQQLQDVHEDEHLTHLQDKIDLFDLINIVGYFHKLTKKWFYLINEIVMEIIQDEESHLTGKITIELTYQDLVEMELDPYSQQDIEFIKEFILIYWNDMVDEVEIGIGLNSICC
ncbi:Uncharacterized protein ANR2 [Spathaspora sp. JA1]|nr:Uncharacterized protein ANR2 [Spathaspora sp. JA1]